MESTLLKMSMEADAVQLEQIYKSKIVDGFRNQPIVDGKIEAVYGALRFDVYPEERPYTFASFVTSVDGRIAFSDAPQGPLIAKKNKLDPKGGLSDWWILNMLRSAADGIIVGTGTLNAEDNFTGHIFDEVLETARIRGGKQAVPWNIVMSLDGTDIPYEHVLFQTREVPVMICTSQKGVEYVKSHVVKEYIVVDETVLGRGDIIREILETIPQYRMVVVATGENVPDSLKNMQILKKLGIDTLLVESPSYMHYLVCCQLMDELFLNCSCIYIGGNALTLGQYGKEFTSEEHPHTKVLSIHTHSDSFFYFRHKLVY